MTQDPDMKLERESIRRAAKEGARPSRTKGHAAAGEPPMFETTIAKGHRAKVDEPAVPETKTIVRFVPLNMRGRTHVANAETARLLAEVGGLPALRRFTGRFYERAFVDPHLDKLIRSHDDPHGERFATWIAEKLGGDASGHPWSRERASRPRCPFHAGGGVGMIDVHDRSSAHFAAWHSPKREPHKFGQHFKLDDCRNWMRLHFWAAREMGCFEHAAFAEYYVKFIGHFVAVYERSAVAFARDSARWSEDPANLERYLAAGNLMHDVIGKPLRAALRDLPEEEAHDADWPYHLA